jgi:molecular chaperone GrpE (heat shock protein)
MQQAVPGVESGRVSVVLQSGYLLVAHGTERVLRPAKVAVSPTA